MIRTRQQTFKIQMISAGGVRHDLYCGLTEEEAIEICQEYGWEFCDENRFVWDLDYVEE